MEGGMTAKISAQSITLKPTQTTFKHEGFVFFCSKPETVELVAKQMLQAVEMQKKIALEESPKY